MHRVRVLFVVAVGLGIGLAATTLAFQSLAKPSYTSAQAKRGATVYMHSCVSCHGDQLDNGEFAAPLAGPVFLQRWGGKGLDEPFGVMTTAMPPDAPGSLGLAAYADVMAFILKENGVAPSTTELPADIAKLKGMAAPK